MKKVTAQIITIGDEILYGQILDTNSKWLSENLDRRGFRVERCLTIGDNKKDILDSLHSAWLNSSLVIVTGGLGPTPDDLTKECLTEFFKCKLVLNQNALNDLTIFFKNKGKEVSELNQQQAMLPECCEMLPNIHGTAPGMWFEKNGKVLISLPGVPFEMKNIMSNEAFIKLKLSFNTPEIFHKVIHTAGIAESDLADKIRIWENNLPDHINLAYLPSLGRVKLRLTGSEKDRLTLEEDVEKAINKLKDRIGKYIYGYDHDTLESVVGGVLRERKLTIGVAESCTGGYISHLLTTVPGSSQYFTGSVIAYNNSVKINSLGVQKDSIESYGAVSEQVVSQMAEGVRLLLNTDIGVATSGIAGPDGGTPEKPVGTVWIAVSVRGRIQTRKLQLWKDRSLNIEASSIILLEFLRRQLSYIN